MQQLSTCSRPEPILLSILTSSFLFGVGLFDGQVVCASVPPQLSPPRRPRGDSGGAAPLAQAPAPSSPARRRRSSPVEALSAAMRAAAGALHPSLASPTNCSAPPLLFPLPELRSKLVAAAVPTTLASRSAPGKPGSNASRPGEACPLWIRLGGGACPTAVPSSGTLGLGRLRACAGAGGAAAPRRSAACRSTWCPLLHGNFGERWTSHSCLTPMAGSGLSGV